MPKYTTGEIARLCGVSVRTVQYYHTREILIPSELSEGGRRLYTEQDLNKMKIICFLRDAGFPINSIGELLAEKDPASVISVMVEQQEKSLQEEVTECRSKLEILKEIKGSLKSTDHFSVESIGDIACIVKNKEKLKKFRTGIIAMSIPVGVMEITSIVLWISQGIWWPFVIYLCFAVPFISWFFLNYWKKISYICPQCHTVFKPNKKEMFFAKHTMTTRKLTCTCCGHKGFCVETYQETEKDEKK